MAFVEVQQSDGGSLLLLRGQWRARNLHAIQEELEELDPPRDASLTIDASQVEDIDLTGAWLLRDYLAKGGERGTPARFKGKPPRALELLDRTLEEDKQVPEAQPDELTFLQTIGRAVVWRADGAREGLDYVGRVSMGVVRAFTSWKRLRAISIARHIYDTGITALPIVSLIAFLMSVIIAYLGAAQLQQFGAEIFVVDLVTVGVLREMGVLLTAIIVAGRSGSAFAAEIGAMRLNEEVDALKATGVDPIETLVMPRVFGLVIALPLLTMVADLVGLVGGALLCYGLLDMPIAQYLVRANEAISPTTFWVGIVKAPIFAVLIASAGTYRGMQVRDSSRELGRLTTVAVVQAIFLVLLADALFAILFMKMEI